MSVQQTGLEIAIVGLSGRFPGSSNLEQFWENLKAGVESISVFPGSANHPVKAGAVLTDIDGFDAPFFGINPKEAEAMDPQHRLFLECAWQALEQAGYTAESEENAIGVFAGVGMGTYLLYNLSPNPEGMAARGFLQTLVGVDKDYLSTRVSYKLNLRGPSVSIGTACSSSLVATHLACQSLLSGECDMAIAAGVAVKVPQTDLTLSPDEIASPDGHCKAFDIGANGTVGGNGLGAVVLKRLEEAIAERDTIYAVIKGSAVNNDGALKVGYTAPSQAGQAKVIRAAQAMAEVEPETITYMEAHGTGTPLGDPIEIAAMTQAFRAGTDKTGYCAVGSVKTNVGHLDAAAGMAGLIKTTLALHHKLLPPSLNFETPNPEIDFANSPFYVNTDLQAWAANGTPRRAGLSSFGFGGTNVHMVLEEAPLVAPSSSSRSEQLLVLSAKTRSALDLATAHLAQHLQQHPDLNLADVAYTLQVGRKAFPHRRMVVGSTLDDALASLASTQAESQATSQANIHPSQGRPCEEGRTETEASQRPVVFMFTGQGAQYVNMARELYDTEPLFRQVCDRSFTLLQPHLGFDLRPMIYPDGADLEQTAQQLQQTAIAQPALFVIEYALAQLWMSWGIRPEAMIGHSIGEYVAACLAGVFSLEAALGLVVKRGQLMQQLSGGAMLSVNLSTAAVIPLLGALADGLEKKIGQKNNLGQTLSIAASNSPTLTVVSGPSDAIEALEQQLVQKQIGCRRLHTSHAFHSSVMDEIAAPFTAAVGQIALNPPQIPLMSNVTGTWMTAADATDPQYWARHLRQTVRFAEGMAELLQETERVFLEVGPGRTLNTLTRQQAADRVVLSSLRHPKEQQSDQAFLLTTLGRLWLAGVPVNWSGFYAHEQRARLPLPTYPFEHQRYWIDPPNASTPKPHAPLAQMAQASGVKDEIADWFYVPSWQQSPMLPRESSLSASACVLVFIDAAGLGESLVEQLQRQGHRVVTVRVGSAFAQHPPDEFCLNPDRAEDYDALIETLRSQQRFPNSIVHLWSVTPAPEAPADVEPVKVEIDTTLGHGFYSLLFLTQALGNQPSTEPVHITVVSNNMQSVSGDEPLCPESATALGPIKVIPQEYPHIRCCSLDVSLARTSLARTSLARTSAISQILLEITAPSDDPVVAYRGRHRWVQTFQPVRLDDPLAANVSLRQEGVYLITGGLGGIGLTLAKHLAETVQAKLVLTGRSGLPDRDAWSDWLAARDERDRTSRTLRKIMDLEALGAEVLVIRADVSDLDQMQQAIAQAESTFGPINGAIHAAGVPGGGIIQRKTRQAAEAVLSPKVKGTRVLEAVLPEELDFLVLCSSLASTVALAGQVDYAAANAFLDAFAHARSTVQGKFTTCINWDAWQDVGMANAARTASRADEAVPTRPVSHPLFESCQQQSENLVRYVSRLKANQHWVLDEHQWAGQGLLPGTAYLEMARAAWADQTHSAQIELRNVCFLTPLTVETEREIHTLLTKRDTHVEFQIQSRSDSPSDSSPDSWQTHASGEIAVPESVSPQRFDLNALKTACCPPSGGGSQQTSLGAVSSSDDLLDTGLGDLMAGPIQFGPRWRTLRWINRSDTEGLALLELPDAFKADLSDYLLHPALLDFATGFLMMQLREPGVAYLPFSYRRLTMKSALSARVYSHIRWLNPPASDTLKFNIVLMDDQGEELIDIEDYTLRRLPAEQTTH